jgi:chromosome segregation ATPase
MKNTNDKLKVTQEKVMILKKQSKEIKAENSVLKGYVEKFESINEELDKKLHKETEKLKLEKSKVKDCKVTQKLFREEIAKLKKDKEVLERLLDISLNEGEQIEDTTSFTPKTEIDEVIEANYIFVPKKSFFEKAKEKLRKIWYGNKS